MLTTNNSDSSVKTVRDCPACRAGHAPADPECLKCRQRTGGNSSEKKTGNIVFIAGGAVIVAALMQFLGC